MNAKTTNVTLVANGVTQDFEFAHAERLLRMPNNGGWKLPENSKYEFVNNGLQRRASKKEDNGQ
jgi:hypothetical protein